MNGRRVGQGSPGPQPTTLGDHTEWASATSEESFQFSVFSFQSERRLSLPLNRSQGIARLRATRLVSQLTWLASSSRQGHPKTAHCCSGGRLSTVPSGTQSLRVLPSQTAQNSSLKPFEICASCTENDDSSRCRICLQPGQTRVSIRLWESRHSCLLFSLKTISESAQGVRSGGPAPSAAGPTRVCARKVGTTDNPVCRTIAGPHFPYVVEQARLLTLLF